MLFEQVFLLGQILFTFNNSLKLGVNEALALGESPFEFQTLGPAGSQCLLELLVGFKSFLAGGQARLAQKSVGFLPRSLHYALRLSSIRLNGLVFPPPQQQVAKDRPAQYKAGSLYSIN